MDEDLWDRKRWESFRKDRKVKGTFGLKQEEGKAAQKESEGQSQGSGGATVLTAQDRSGLFLF